MEAKVIDFKQPLESHIGMINKNQEPKTKDFTSTLDSVTKNTESNAKDSNKVNKDVKSTVVEEVEKEDKVLYENMINILSIKAPINDDSEVNLEEMEINIDELLSSTVLLDENSESKDETLLDEDILNLMNPDVKEEDLEKLLKKDSKELLIEKPINTEDKEIKSNLLTEKISNVEFKTETKELDEDLVQNEEKNLVNVDKIINQETGNEFDDTNQENRASSDSQYELVNSTKNEDDSKVKNESFVPFIKDGIEFSSDQPIEADAPIIEPKEVVKQIVDQVKFDLSENKNEMKLTLKPESLGEMTMNVEVAKDGIIAKIMVDNYRTKEIIEGNIFQLKEGIKNTGMEIKTVEVFVGNGSDFDQHSFNQSNQFNLKQNSKKLRIKSDNNKSVNAYEEGIVEDKTKPLNYTNEGGLNLFA